MSGEGRTAWQLNYYDDEGELQQKQFQTKREAEDERIRIEGELAKGVHVADRKSITVADAAAAFLSDFERLVDSGKRARITLIGYETHVRLHLKPFEIARTKIARLKGPNCAAYARDLETSRTDDCARKVFTTFRQIIDYALEMGWIGSNPAKSISVRTAPNWDADKEILDIPPLDSLKALLKAASRNYSRRGAKKAVSVD